MDMLDDWAVWLTALGMASRTIDTRVGGIRALMRHQELRDPQAITTRQLAAWLAACASPWTRYTYWQSAKAWCLWLVDEGVRQDNPLARIPRPAMPRNAPRPVPMSVVRQVILVPPSTKARNYVVLAAFAGLRVHEIAKVRGEDVDVDAGWLFVTGKGGQRAAVPMHDLVASLAQGQRGSGFWFPGSDAGHVRANSVSQTIRRALARHGTSATAHALRHTFGTYVLRASRDIRLTQQALRHASVSSTQIYTQVSAADLQAAVRSLDWAAA